MDDRDLEKAVVLIFDYQADKTMEHLFRFMQVRQSQKRWWKTWNILNKSPTFGRAGKCQVKSVTTTTKKIKEVTMKIMRSGRINKMCFKCRTKFKFQIIDIRCLNKWDECRQRIETMENN